MGSLVSSLWRSSDTIDLIINITDDFHEPDLKSTDDKLSGATTRFRDALYYLFRDYQPKITAKSID